MATPRFVTVSNEPKVNDSDEEEVRDVLSEYGIRGTDGHMNMSVERNEEDTLVIRINGYGEFRPVRLTHSDVPTEPVDSGPERGNINNGVVELKHADLYTRFDHGPELLARLSRYLDEEFAVKTVSNTKSRAAAGRRLWVGPDGVVRERTLDHGATVLLRREEQPGL